MTKKVTIQKMGRINLCMAYSTLLFSLFQKNRDIMRFTV